jgi:phage terminase small subunit
MAHFRNESMGRHGPRPLTGLQKRFLDEYLVDQRPKAAAIRAGYAEGDAAHSAWRLLRHPIIAAAIRADLRQRTDRLRLSADRILWEHVRIGFADAGRFVRFTAKGPRLRNAELGPDDTAAVREVIRRKGGFQIKLYDKRRSLDHLTKVFDILGGARAVASKSQEEERQQSQQFVAEFCALVDAIRARLNVNPEISRNDALAVAVARGDPEAILLAQRAGYIRGD